MNKIPTIIVTPTSDSRWKVYITWDILIVALGTYESKEKAIEAGEVIQIKKNGCLKVCEKENINFDNM